MLHDLSRAWLLACFLSLVIFTAALSQTQSPVHGDGLAHADQKTTPNAKGTENGLRWQQGGNDNGSHGALQLREALTELNSIKNSKRFIQIDRKSGLVGATVYYAKEAFVLLFMNGPKQADHVHPEENDMKLSKPLAKAVKLLEGAARQQNADALFLLAEMNFHGNYSHPRNYKQAFRRYSELASLTGNSSAQHMLGFMYATGIGNAVEQDQAKALMYHTFAALAGDTRSEMTTAFRHHSGIGTPRSCNEAATYYKRVADKAIAYARSGPPGGMSLVRDSYRLADEEGGVYGEGASYTSSGIRANKGGPNSDQNAAFEDVLEYLDLMMRKGDPKAAFTLGRLHYDGSRTLKRNVKKSMRYFKAVTGKYWAKDGSVTSEDKIGVAKLASKAAAYIGRMYLRGEGEDQNFKRAMGWFKKGLQNGDSFCQYEIGLMYLLGLGVRKDALVAADYLKQSALQDWPAAQVQLAKLFLDQGDLGTALQFFELAARHGHIEAIYHLAEINNNGVGRDRNCAVATAYYKAVAEKAEALHSSFEEANRAYEDGDKETALIGYMMAAEQGYEHGQANVAYLLDVHRSILSFDSWVPWKKRASSVFRDAALAMVYWTRSAKQANIDSMVKMGDYYLIGHGVERDIDRAVACYQSAAEMQGSAQAMWNLGWVHENGIGVEQDFHLAKRLYDQALETTAESYLPVKLSLIKLRMRSWWNTITHGKVKSIQPDPEEPRQFKTWSEWLANFLEDEHPYYHSADSDEDRHEQLHDPMPGGDDYYDEVDEGIVESLIVIVLASALAFLVYYRQARMQNHRRALEDRRQRQAFHANAGAAAAAVAAAPPPAGQQADGGFFPPPEDPNFNDWRAGGIGH